jgi:hypothetical protein
MSDTSEALEMLNQSRDAKAAAQERKRPSSSWWPFGRGKKAEPAAEQEHAAEEPEPPAEEEKEELSEAGKAGKADKAGKAFRDGAESEGKVLRMGFILPAFVALALIAVTRVVFAMILAGERSPKEVSWLMEMDRALGWLMSPLAALVTALGAIHIDAGGARRGFVIVGCILAVWLLAAPLVLTQYISPLDTSDLEAAGKRAGAKLWHRRAASELAVVLLGVGGMMLFWWRRNKVPQSKAARAG